jgi:hypothetical protein
MPQTAGAKARNTVMTLKKLAMSFSILAIIATLIKNNRYSVAWYVRP